MRTLYGRARPVVLYCAVCGPQAVGWCLLTQAALTRPVLAKNERAELAIQKNRNYSYLAMATYTMCAIVAIWLPQLIALVISLIWILWLVVGIRMREE